MNDVSHSPVLLDEALQALEIRADGRYVDATYGRGGHSDEIVSRLGPCGTLVVLDRDPDAVHDAQQRYGTDKRVLIAKVTFSMLRRYIDDLGLTGQVNGILFDLGVSSPQFDTPSRGFSFRLDGPLDMRMDRDTGITATQWLATASETEIARVIRDYGEERYARRVARAVIRERQVAPIVNTRRLAEIVAHAVPTREAGKSPATRTFQALRIHINRELDELREVLPQAMEVLAPAGRLVVISFHSLEDRVAKRFMRAEAKGEKIPARLPVRDNQIPRRLRIIGRALRPSQSEIKRNPRARSAIMRVAERTGSPNA